MPLNGARVAPYTDSPFVLPLPGTTDTSNDPMPDSCSATLDGSSECQIAGAIFANNDIEINGPSTTPTDTAVSESIASRLSPWDDEDKECSSATTASKMDEITVRSKGVQQLAAAQVLALSIC